METKKILTLVGVGLIVVIAIGFMRLTGNVVNETMGLAECNAADFNADGKIDYNDRLTFGETYASDAASEESCSRADLNQDGIINSLDNDEFGKLYSLVEGRSTGDCVLKKLACEESEVVEAVEESEVGELPSEKVGFFKKIGNFFKGLFEK
tara:strand:+ start:14687 stop:15142 length:456 start_codon:yes stop_codon:yes gene_type:complete